MYSLKKKYESRLFQILLITISCCVPLHGETNRTNTAPYALLQGKRVKTSQSNKILFIMPGMNVGGTERAFLSMTQNLPLNPNQYDICILERGHDFEKLLRKDAHIISLQQACKKKYATVVSYAQWINHKDWVPRIRAKHRVQWIHVDLLASGMKNIFHDSKLRSKINSFVCVSDQAMKNFQKLYPREAHKAVTIHNVVDDEEIIRKSKEPQKEIPSDSMLNVVTVCRVAPEKGLDRAIRVHQRLEAEGIHFRWYIVGGDAVGFLAPLQKAVRENNLEKNFIFLGARMNPYPYIKAADLFVLPSYHEGWGLVITEAMILGRPVLSTDVAGAREQLKQGVTGIIVDSNDEAIYQGLKKMLTNPSLRQRLRDNLTTYRHDNVSVYKKLMKVLHAQKKK